MCILLYYWAKMMMMIAVAVARSSSVGVAICYGLPASSFTSHLHIMARNSLTGDAKGRVLWLTKKQNRAGAGVCCLWLPCYSCTYARQARWHTAVLYWKSLYLVTCWLYKIYKWYFFTGVVEWKRYKNWRFRRKMSLCYSRIVMVRVSVNGSENCGPLYRHGN